MKRPDTSPCSLCASPVQAEVLGISTNCKNFALSGAVTASPGESTPKMKSQMECLSKALKFNIADFTNKSGE